MRGFQTNPSNFCNYVEKVSLDYWNQVRNKVLRNHVLDSSFSNEDLCGFWFPDSKLITMIRLGILHWYAPVEIKFLLRLEIEEEVKVLSLEDRFLVSQILSDSKGEMLVFLLETKLWHERDFRGNILMKNTELLPVVKLRFKKTGPVKKIERKRGYQDHGSRTLDHNWLPKSDYSLTQEQNQIEFEREAHKDTLLLSKGFLE